jgi:hypothetical protein
MVACSWTRAPLLAAALYSSSNQGLLMPYVDVGGEFLAAAAITNAFVQLLLCLCCSGKVDMMFTAKGFGKEDGKLAQAQQQQQQQQQQQAKSTAAAGNISS